MEPLAPEETQRLTKYVAEKVLNFMHESWSRLQEENLRLMMVMAREFSELSDEHNIHALGMKLLDLFYDTYLPKQFLAPPKPIFNALCDQLNERIDVERAKLFSSADPKWLRQLEDMCMPTLFEHNLHWILTENDHLRRFLREKKEALVQNAKAHYIDKVAQGAVHVELLRQFSARKLLAILNAMGLPDPSYDLEMLYCSFAATQRGVEEEGGMLALYSKHRKDQPQLFNRLKTSLSLHVRRELILRHELHRRFKCAVTELGIHACDMPPPCF